MKKKISCPACKGHGFISKFNDCSIWSEKCLECNGIGEIEVPMTNGDKFRSMSDEELASWFSKLVYHDCATTFRCFECHADDDGCAKEILKFIKEEAAY